MFFIPLMLIIFYVYIYINLEEEKVVDLSYFYDDNYEDKLPTY